MVPTDELPNIIDEAWIWLMDEYGLRWSLNKIDLHFNFVLKSTATKPRLQVEKYEDRRPIFKFRIIRDRRVWHTYAKKTTGVKADMVKCSNRFAILMQLIHEFTHMINYIHPDYDASSEVATTRNEMKFAFNNYFHYFVKCKPLIDKRYLPKNYNGKPECVLWTHQNSITFTEQKPKLSKVPLKRTSM